MLFCNEVCIAFGMCGGVNGRVFGHYHQAGGANIKMVSTTKWRDGALERSSDESICKAK